MKLLFIAFINESHKQLLMKINDQYKAFKELNPETACIVVGKGGFEIDFSTYEYEYINLDRLRKFPNPQDDRKLSFYLLGKHLKDNDYDLIYMRYSYGDEYLLEFVEKNPNIIFEHHSNEPEELKVRQPDQYQIEKKYGALILDKVLGVVSGTNEVIEFEQARVKKHLPGFLMTNGVNIKDIPLVNSAGFKGKYNFMFLSNLTQEWQGIDRVIEGLKNYKDKNKIIIHMFGNVSQNYKDMIDQYNLNDNFIFWGYKERDELNKIADKCHAAIGPLAVHRKNLKGASILKNREYCTRGIPFIYSGDDPDFMDDLPFTYKEEPTDEPVDISHLVELADKFLASENFKHEIRKYAEENLSWIKKKKDVLDFFQTILNNNQEMISKFNAGKRDIYKNYKRITFFAGDNNHFHFVEDIIRHFADQGFITEKVYLDNFNPDKIYSILRNTDIAWFEWAQGPIEIASNLPKTCKIICRIHRFEIYGNFTNHINWSNIDDLIFITPNVYEEFKELHKPNIDDLTRVHIVKNSIILDDIPFIEKEKGFNIAYIARFHGAKNPSLMLQILKKLVEIDNRYKVYMIGGIQDITEYKYTMYLAEKMQISDNLIYEGKINNVFEWLKDKNYILSTSVIEGLPVNILEAMAAGCKPVIHNYFADPAAIFGDEYIFNTVDDAVDMVTSDDYNSTKYREIIQNNYNFNIAKKTFEEIADSDSNTYLDAVENPFFSIIMHITGQKSFLLQSIQNILSQEYENYEILLCSDKLNEKTLKDVKKINNPKLRILAGEKKNQPVSIDLILEKAKGDYFLLLDDTSVLSDNVFSTLRKNIILYPNVDLFYPNILLDIEEKKSRTQSNYMDWFGRDNELPGSLILDVELPFTGMLAQRHILVKAGKNNFHVKDFFYNQFLYRLFACSDSKINLKLINQTLLLTRLTGSGNLDQKDEQRIKENILDSFLGKYTIKELFPSYNWLNEAIPSKADVFFRMGIKYLGYGNVKKAIEFLVESVKLVKPSLEKEKLIKKIFRFADSAQKQVLRKVISIEDEFDQESVFQILDEINNLVENKDYEAGLNLTENLLRNIDEINILGVDESFLLCFSGRIYLLKGSLDKAEEQYNAALKKNPQSSIAYTGLGDIYLIQNDSDKAKAMYEHAVKYDPSNEKAQKGIMKLGGGRDTAKIHLYSHETITDEPKDNPAAQKSDNNTAALNEGKISVCIPTYNRSEFLKEAIQSVLQQSYEHFEIIIVDDGSKDNTAEVVSSFKDDRIKYFRNNENMGRPVTRNRAVKEAQNEYILWLDDDDLLENTIVEEYINILHRDPSIDIIYCNLQLFDTKTGEKLSLIEAKDWSYSAKGLLESLVNGSGITNPGVLIRKSLIEEAGYYDEVFVRAQDFEFWSRIATKARLFKLNKVLVNYRKHTGNISLGQNVDYSYDSLALKKIVKAYPLSIIYPNMDWSQPQESRNKALYNIAKNLLRVRDYCNAEKVLSKILSSSFNMVVLSDLITCNLLLGNVDKSSDLLKRYETSVPLEKEYSLQLKNRIENYKKHLKQVKQCLKNSKYGEAKELINNAAKEFGLTYDFELLFAECSKEEGNEKETLEHKINALKLSPTSELLNEILEECESEQEKEKIKQLYGRVTGELHLFHENQNEQSNLVSVIIPTYNRKEKLPDAINSVVNQTVDNWEIIIINDAGDDVKDIANSFNDGRIKLVNHGSNKGLAAARNTGIRESSGKFLAFLDDDDIFYPAHLETSLMYLNKDCRVVYTDSVRKSYYSVNGGYILADQSVPYSMEYDRNKLLLGNIAPVNCFVFEKSLIDEVGVFNEELPVLEDWEFWICLSSASVFKHIKKNTVQVNWYSDGSTLTSSKQELFKTVRDNTYKKYRTEIDKIDNFHEIVDEFNSIWQNDNAEFVPVVSIIVLSYNQFEYTKKFVESLLKNTKILFELIVIDNGSDEETVNYLKSLEGIGHNIKIVFNEKNVGFPEGVNQGIKMAGGKYFLVTNNDIILTEHWVNKLINAAETDDKIGIVGPISNSVSGAQLDKNAKYDSIEHMHKYADKISLENAGQIQVFPRVAFLCTLIKKEVVDRIGGLDERFAPGNFEDDDFCLRTQLAGFKTVIAKDVFIHHFGSRSFKADGSDAYAERLKINEKKFVDKWGADPNEIWLQGKKVKSRGVKYPINNSSFIESFDRALMHVDENELDVAVIEAERALEYFDTENKEGYEQISKEDILNLIGGLYLQQHDIQKAHDYFKKELEMYPDSGRACYGLAETFYLAGKFEQAKTMYEWTIKNGENNPTTWNKLNDVNQKLNYDINHNSLNLLVPGAKLTLSDAEKLVQAGDYDSAKSILHTLIEEEPENIDILNGLAFVYLVERNFDESIKYIKKVLSLDPENQIAHSNLKFMDENI